MTDYKSIVGKGIKSLTANPDNDQAEGQIWYNSTDGVFRNVVISEAWTSGGSLNTARNYLAGCGIQTSALGFGGKTTTTVANTEEYNGSGFSAGGDLGTARRYLGGVGTQTAGLAVSGYTTTLLGNVEEYDGSTWSEQTDIGTSRSGLAGAGIQTAGLVFAGSEGTGAPFSTKTEHYNGSSWTNGGALSTGRRYLAGAGTSTAALAFGGKLPSNTGSTEEYNGSSWTTSPGSLNDSRGYLAGAGTQTSALAFGGYNNKTSTEQYDGSTWSTKPALATGREGLAGGGATAAAAVAFGGKTTAVQSLTEEFTTSINTITAAAYSSVPNLNNGRDVEGFGSKNGTTTAAYVGNGGVPPNAMSNYTEEFDGSAWTAGGSLPGSWRHSGGTGIQTAGLCVGGFNGPSNLNGVYHYNGSSWSGGGNYPVAQYAVSVAGTQTAAIGMGGGSDTTPANTYNGSSWTSAGTMSVGRSWFGSAGTTTASLAIGGANATTGQCEEYDGSSWTSGGSLVTGRTSVTTCSFGTQTAAGQSGANQPTNPAPGKINFLQTYDGTSWLTGANLGTGRQNSSGSGTTTSHLVATGFGPGTTYSVAAEEYTPGSSVATSKTLTTS